jgi:membrane protein DedA with SNARE-associated domain
MLEILLGSFQGSNFGIWALFLILILCGLGLPVPEDVVLISAGMVAGEGGQSWIQTSVLMWFGVMAGDSLTFLIGRHFGVRLLASRWALRFFPATKQAKARGMFERYGSTVLFIARFLPGLRAPLFASAGAMHVPYIKFAVLDGSAALISAPVFVWLGHWLWVNFHEDLEQLSSVLARTHSYSLWIALVLVVVSIVATLLWRRFWRKKSASKTQSANT